MSASGDSHGWVLEAVDLYELPLQRYARRLLGDFDLAADAVQHAFLKLCEQSQSTLEGRVAPWLFRVCRNRALDHMRHAARQHGDLDRDDPGTACFAISAVDPAALAERQDLAGVVRNLLADLPAPQRETIDLWCEGFTHKEIAMVTGRSEGHVRVLLHRGITGLRRHPSVRALIAGENETNEVRA